MSVILVLLVAAQVTTPACQDPVTSPYICEQAFELLETGARCEQKFDICVVERAALERKLEVRTSSVVVKEVYIESDTIPWWGWLLMGGLAVGGFSAGLAL